MCLCCLPAFPGTLRERGLNEDGITDRVDLNACSFALPFFFFFFFFKFPLGWKKKKKKKIKRRMSMALNTWLLCLLSIFRCGLAVQENPMSVELSCGAGPIHVVLEPPRPLLLDCHLGSAETPLNITWLQDGVVLSESEAVRLLPNSSLLLLPSAHDGKVSAGMEGAYSCLSGSSFGTLTSRSVTLQLARLSTFLRDPEPQVVPAGGTARFECHIDGVPAPSITWEKNHMPLPVPAESVNTPRFVTLPNGILQILDVTADDGGLYRCVASNSAHKLYSQDASLTVTSGHSEESEVMIVAPPRDLTVVLGRPAVLECMAHGQPKPFVSWSRQDGKPIAADVLVLATNLIIPHTLSHHDGVYVCRANKPKTREFVSASAEIRVLAPPVIVKPPESVSLSRGNTARFVCNSSGSPAASLLWLKDGERLRWTARVKTQSPGVLLINQLRPDDAGYYQCLASNVLGSACATAKLSVIVRAGLPSPPLHLQAMSHSSTSVLLTWDPPEHNREQVIGFSIHYQRATAGFDNMEYQFAVNNDTTEFHVKELQPHTAYTFYMVAYSPMGASRPSQSITVETVEDEEVFSVELDGNETQVVLRYLKPNHTNQLQMAAGTRAGFVLFPPTELKVTAKMHSLHVTWQPPPNHTQITSYKLAYREVDGEEAASQKSPAADASRIRLRKRVKHYEITGLAPDRLYEVKVWACNKQAEGYPAIWKGRTEKFTDRVRPLDHPPPLPPSIVKAQANSSTSIWLRWEKPPFSNVRIINYTIRCSPAGNRNASLVSYYTSTSQEILLGALKPFTRYELAIQSNGISTGGPFSSTVEESTLADRPSSPPTDLQLSAIDSFSVLVSWRPPLEPNGIIVSYRMLYSGNLSQPDDLWTNLSHDGSVTSTEVLGLMSGTRYYFKMGACTEVGMGPFSPVKDVHTPPKKYELDIHAVTGIIVGVCLGLLCILVCMCVSFRNGKSRDAPAGLEPSLLNPQYRRSAHPVPAVVPNCTDCHELETLMPPGAQDPVLPPTEPNEQQSLMGSVGGAYDTPTDLKPSWNGSVSREWASRISTYRETMTENSPCLINGPRDTTESKNSREEQPHSLGSNQVEADVIVHSELSDPVEEVQELQSDTNLSLGSPVSRFPCREDASPPSLSSIKPDTEIHPASPCSPNHFQDVLANHNGPLENGLAQLTLGGVTEEGVSPEHLQPALENGDHRLRPSRKALSQIGLSTSPPAFARSGLVHSTSGAHSYLCS
ncbi:immunoglobulin superfamily DCC subclass member 4 isoform X5 [Pangasianodon hypophthalmus]|uniref:immunoglobulin superfamily DCC subclass member 4 isoform X5 n=1 Tax=Pangasianodon hypophthalmus TaxID=310915 RepID=UPI002307C838|nr:immunoglobulin superfamily DCC subclass member 4 isoform X5 [Pangasianodon hypophthalmus]